MVFYTASQAAKKLFCYPLAAGEFYCTAEYEVQRERYDSILALLVLDGAMVMEQLGVSLCARKNELLLVDCCKPHRYAADHSAHTLWVHFDGGHTREWFRELAAQKGQKLSGAGEAAEHITRILQGIRQGQDEYDLSCALYGMLCAISRPQRAGGRSGRAEAVEAAKRFMRANYQNELSVAEIASAVHLSTSYFSRLFREETGSSPYDHLLKLRLARAKELLLQTDSSIESIACQTGFNSVSNFIFFFKKETLVSPLRFRKLRF